MLFECNKNSQLKMNLAVMDGRNLNFPDDVFDTVVGVFVLSSSDSPEKIISEMYRVCKKNGKILIIDRGRCDDMLTMVLLNLYRYEYIFQYGYDQCANIEQIVKSIPAEIIISETKQGGHLYFYILEKK